ncbi:MAG: hypothetical protein AVDCRST_MAG76-3682 [uncultured Acidimicrobiales bacterium]|uniref:Uncharacterized protein n=1 Tax=uncultured Acidimicrobiales bacterium TaxID=310071 RepID=A0A6J4JBW0_9ACTN|nr:MAG: hypothetical protein AVDCRST_MAG76-3682 [uncultured Acidimicrobiales bacterium]
MDRLELVPVIAMFALLGWFRRGAISNSRAMTVGGLGR